MPLLVRDDGGPLEVAPEPPPPAPAPTPLAPAPPPAPVLLLAAPGRPLIDVGDGTLLAPPAAVSVAPAPPQPPVTAPPEPEDGTPAPRPIVQPGGALIDVGDGTLIAPPPRASVEVVDEGGTAPAAPDTESFDIGDDPEAGAEPTQDEFDYWAGEQDTVESGLQLFEALSHPAPGTLIGFPLQGTHGKAFNIAGGSDNWQSENAVDVWLYPGTHVTACIDGVISPGSWGYGLSSKGGHFAGWRVHLVGSGGRVFFYTHMVSVAVVQGQRVRAGDVLGASGVANGVPHLHFAAAPPLDPRAYYLDAFTLKGKTNIGTSPTTGGPPDEAPQAPEVEQAWLDLMRVFGLTLPVAASHIRDARHDVVRALT